ncbi:MAG: cob(I)yrinic acid a,c-diamide adenosyltransferase [Bdellovibrio sp.]|nr:cob(I)yrinic acid a,c-diamide adenosyltransferase [Bdellovibrio sp.]
MKIYTKTGDQGLTTLFGGQRISKSSEILYAYGTVDELSAIIGVLLSYLNASSICAECVTQLQSIQRNLFIVSSYLASPPDKRAKLKIGPLAAEDVKQIEGWIDQMAAEVSPLSSFILAGGHITAAYAHLARTVARRGERDVIRCFELTPDWKIAFSIEYFNRLSDYLFILSRCLNLKMKTNEITWP